jgi:hypothetical protein
VIGERVGRYLLGAALLLASVNVAADDTSKKVTVHSLGPKAIRIRIAEGTAYPCESSSNVQLFTGKIEPGATIDIASATECVCIDQTYEPFPDTGWGTSRFQCRPIICDHPGKGAKCKPDPDQTIRIEVRSTPPTG